MGSKGREVEIDREKQKGRDSPQQLDNSYCAKQERTWGNQQRL